MKIVILGSATVIAPIIDALGYPIIAVLNDSIPVGDTEGRFEKHLIAGTSRDLWTYLKDEDAKLVFTVMTMKKKRKVWDKFINLGIPGNKLATLIHPTAIIPQQYCKYGKIVMAPLAQLSPGAEVKDRCILFGNSFIGHDSTLEEAVVVANNASIQARVHIGRGVHVGSNSTILSGIHIGEFAVVGAGAVVTKDVLPDTIVTGVPAKRMM